MALQEGGYDVSVWQEWSAKGYKYQHGECEAKWSGFDNSGGVTMGTLIHMAKSQGYRGHYMPSLPQSKNLIKPDIQIHHWKDLKTLKRRKYLIKGFLDQGGMSVVYGASNSGKTFIALDMCCHIAMGWKWRDNKTRQGSVVYIAGEGGFSIYERLTAFRKHHNLDGYGDVYLIPQSICLAKEDSNHLELIKSIQSIPDLKLVVIDTLARAMGGGDENSSIDMGAFIKHCDIIREETNAHVMVIHHSGKNTQKGARGHSSLKAAVDTEIEVNKENMFIDTNITKQRDGETGNKLFFELRSYQVDEDEDGDPIYSCALERAASGIVKEELTGNPRKTLQVLDNLMIERAEKRKPKQGMKEVDCVRIADFKEHFIKAGISTSDKPDSVSKAFNRNKESLKDKGYLGEWDGYVWLLDKTDTDGQIDISS